MTAEETGNGPGNAETTQHGRRPLRRRVSRSRELAEVISEVRRSGFCVHPIRLRSTSPGVNHKRVGGHEIAVACRDRRRAVCPACAHTYAGDAYQVIATGLRGGKGVPASVATHPRAFVTLTAGSYGAVHRATTQSSSSRSSGSACLPRRDRPVCPHGRAASCGERHSASDPKVGEPLCPECFDYRGAILFNAQVSKLWNATRIATVRHLARQASISERQLRCSVRLAFFKTVEFQRRGLIHLHVIVRADGVASKEDEGRADGVARHETECRADGVEGSGDTGDYEGDEPTSKASSDRRLPPPEWVTPASLICAVREAVSCTTIPTPTYPGGTDDRMGWGPQVDARPFDSASTADEVAAIARYTAKYVSKGSESSGALARRVVSLIALEEAGLSAHVERLVATAWELGGMPELAGLNLRDHAHTFGFGGYVSSKSRGYSTTLGALRQARAKFRAIQGEADDSGEEEEAVSWRYVGRGYGHPDADRLAHRLADADRGRRR